MRRLPTLAEIERRHILNTLRLCGNNRTHAAKVLGVSIRGLRLKLHSYQEGGIDIPPSGKRAGRCTWRRYQRPQNSYAPRPF
jgi:transposase